MRVRGYRITLNRDGLKEAVLKLLTVAILFLVPYAVGYIPQIVWGVPPDPEPNFPLPFVYWSTGAAILIITALVVAVAGILIGGFLHLAVDIEKVSEEAGEPSENANG